MNKGSIRTRFIKDYLKLISITNTWANGMMYFDLVNGSKLPSLVQLYLCTGGLASAKQSSSTLCDWLAVTFGGITGKTGVSASRRIYLNSMYNAVLKFTNEQQKLQ